MKETLLILTGLPLIGSVLCLLFPNKYVRNITIVGVSLTMICAACFLCSYLLTNKSPLIIEFDNHVLHLMSLFILVIDIIILLYVIWRGVTARRFMSPVLAVMQICLLSYFEFNIKPHMNFDAIRIDNLSLILIMLASCIGPMILIFAMGYMREHEEHLEMSGSKIYYRPKFFATIMFFLFAMNILAMCNNVLWIYTFWEITTLCSFLLIQTDKTPKSIKNAFRTLDLNMLGGVALILGVTLAYSVTETLSLSEICSGHLLGVSGNTMAFAVVLLCFAGFTKSAQFPFQSWLLGAMVAPTPVSALLHSSTMVKAGVYLVIRMAPLMADTMVGTMVAIAGGFTFCAASIIAISQSNGKKVLAYSTIANLGLIICCAGLGTQASVAAAVLLMIFHAVSKGMLFLAVGTIEQKIDSRDIEDMQGLLKIMPFTTFILAVGIISMLLPPFGVLLTKWIAIEASVFNPIVMILIILGSAFTVVFWAKWIGIISTASFKPSYKREEMFPSMKVVLTAMFLMVIGASCFVGLLYKYLVHPFIIYQFNTPYMKSLELEGFTAGLNVISSNGYVGGFAVMAVFILILMFTLLIPSIIHKTNLEKVRPPYFGGELANGDIRGIEFIGPGDKIENVIVRNYYFNNIFGEEKLTTIMISISIAIIVIMFGIVI